MKKIGTGTVIFESAPTISSYASVVGKKESEGPLARALTRSSTTAAAARKPLNRLRAACRPRRRCSR